MFQTGDVLNETYRIEEVLGAGGGGEVYKAYHLRIKTDVAVKRVKDDVKGKLDDRAEVDVLKNLQQTYLPRIYDFVSNETDVYTVMDFIPGQNLKQAARQHGPFDQKQVLKWAVQLSEALAYLHAQKPAVIHSDIKPENIMLQPDGNICLIDFNVSLAFDENARKATGISVGYAPPEQYHSVGMYGYISRLQADRPAQGGVQAQGSGPILQGGGKAHGSAQAQDDEQVSQRELLESGTVSAFTETAAASGTVSAFTETAAASGTVSAFTETAAASGTVSAFTETEDRPARQPKSGSEQPAGRQETPPGFLISLTQLSEVDADTARLLDSTIGQGVDERSDVYSLGATLYFLLTGVKPSAHYWENRPIEQQKVPVSEGMAHIIDTCMQLDPARRYQNGGELHYALTHIRELDSRYKAHQRKRKGRIAALAAMYGAAALLLVSGFALRRREISNAYSSAMLSAETLISEGSYDEAQELLSSQIASVPSRIDAYAKQIEVLYRSGDYEECIRYGREVINAPEYSISTDADRKILADMYYLVGNAYYERDDYENASRVLELAIRYDPENSNYYRDIALCSAKAGNAEGALEYLDTAISKGLAEDSVSLIEGEILYEQGEYADAVEKFTRAIQITASDSVRSRAIALCAAAYRQLGPDYEEEEIRFLEQYRGTAGAGTVLTEQLAEVLASGGRTGEAAGLYEELVRGGNASFRTYENLALLLERDGRFDAAQEILEQMLELFPARYETYKRLAFLEAERQGALAQEERDYHKVKEYADLAEGLYGSSTEDTEMDRLRSLIEDLRRSEWLD